MTCFCWSSATGTSPRSKSALPPKAATILIIECSLDSSCQHPHRTSPSAATMIALIVCSRFSAWSKTSEAEDSTSATSLASSLPSQAWSDGSRVLPFASFEDCLASPSLDRASR